MTARRVGAWCWHTALDICTCVGALALAAGALDVLTRS